MLIEFNTGMKKKSTYIVSSILTLALFLTLSTSRAQGSVSFQVFYDQLSPYGSWVNYNQYGYVWVPTAVSSGFRPYGTAGHWVFTPDGWTWISDYAWGWAPFHYGNWLYDDSYGWMWVPGYDWAPAWVTWGEYGGDYCWAPVGPSIEIGVAWSSYRPPAHYWTFIPRGYITRTNINNYFVHYNTNVTVVRNITVIHNVNAGGGRGAYMRGPDASSVARYTHSAIRPVAIRESSGPGRGQVQNGQVSIYRPAISRAPAARPAPRTVRSLQTIKPTSLPGYNRHIQPAAGNTARPASPSSAERTRPSNQPAARPAPNNPPVRHAPVPAPKAGPQTTSPHPSRPTPNQPVAPRPGTHTERQSRPQPRPVPQQERSVPQQRRSVPQPVPQHQRSAPQQPRPVPQHQPRPVQQQTPRPVPQPARPPQPENKPAEPGRDKPGDR